MTSLELQRGRKHDRHYAIGWLVSVLLHSGLIVGAILFTRQVQLAPQPEPFKWNVALVSSDSAPLPSAVTSSVDPSSTLTSAKPAMPTSKPQTTFSPPKQARSEPLQQKVPAQVEMPPPTRSPQAEPQSMKPVPKTVTPAPPVTVKAGEPAILAPVAPLPPVEPTSQAPAPVESVSPSHRSTDSETASTPPQKESDSAMVAPVAQSESPTLSSSIASPSSEPAPTLTPQMTARPSERAETAVSADSSGLSGAALASSRSNRPARVDYGWLSEVILRRVEELKRYPAEARVDRTEGKVVVKAVINEDGSVDDVEVFQSSGSMTLDKAAVDLMRRAAPFSLPQLLGKPRVTIKIPMNYRLDR